VALAIQRLPGRGGHIPANGLSTGGPPVTPIQLPGILLAALATIGLGVIILAESSLSFLQFGVPPPYPSWGSMLSGSGRSFMYRAPWMALWPGLAISLAVFGFNMLGDALRDLLDPRLKGR